MTRRIGVLGGTFDPVHLAHVELARQAIAQCQLTELIVVPCALPPHRSPAQASNLQRMHMLKLAFAGMADIRLCDYELTKTSMSYTVETVEFISGRYPDAQLLFCLGADSLRDFTTWHRWQDILSTSHLAVMNRDNTGAEIHVEISESTLADSLADSLVDSLADSLADRRVNTFAEINKQAGQILEVKTPAMPVSATLIREHIKACSQNANKQFEKDVVLSTWLDPKVLNYIVNNKVYQ